LTRYVSKESLRAIDENVDVAAELCLLMLSNFSDTYYRMNGIGFDSSPNEKEGWKNLSSVLLREQFAYDPCIYRRILSVLEEGSSKGPIIECDQNYAIGKKCLAYRLSSAYRSKGVASYELKTEKAIEVLTDRKERGLNKSIDNPICKNLLEFYKQLEIPSLEQIETEAKKLLAANYRTKKGKLLTRLGKKTKPYWKKPQERVFIEDSVQIYQYLTTDGIKIPLVGSERSGGRVVDSFTLTPSWIRNMVTVDGERLVELDYNCLHPNIAMQLYGGKTKYLSHRGVAKALNLDLVSVKTEHLSFFNKRLEDMKASPLYTYYTELEPEMLSQIQEDKTLGPYGYKTTSVRMFQKEVQIMTEVISRLNQSGVFVGYVYDAFLCQKKHQELVRETMNQVAEAMRVFTTCC
jgi:hypothetical protein